VKTTRAAQVRRRRLATTLAVTMLTVVAIVVAARASTGKHARLEPDPLASTATLADAEASLRSSIQAYLGDREGAVSVAVYDNVTSKLITVHPKYRGRTASIVKADILETLLHRTRGHISDSQRDLATKMMEHSDNDAATDLWNQDGGAPGVAAYDAALGIHQTHPNVDWGLTTTSAKDQVTIVRALLHHNDVLTDKSRRFQRRLMRHVEADQRWGISGGVPRGVTFGNKNGWLPVDEDRDRWAVNSIGWVRGEGKRYELAVLTQHNDTEGYGIHTIEHIAAMVWKHMATDTATSG
jgi:hypothetical protein